MSNLTQITFQEFFQRAVDLGTDFLILLQHTIWSSWFLTILTTVVTLCWVFRTWSILRWPIIAFVTIFVAVEFGLYISLRWAIKIGEWVVAKYSTSHQREQAVFQSKKIETYSQWKGLAYKLDELEERTEWKEKVQSRFYDYELVSNLLNKLRESRRAGDVRKVAFYLRAACHKNVGGIDNEELHYVLRSGTKTLVEQYVNEVQTCVKYVFEHGLDDVQKSICDVHRSPGDTVPENYPNIPATPSTKQAIRLAAIGAAAGLVRSDPIGIKPSSSESEPDLLKTISPIPAISPIKKEPSTPPRPSRGLTLREKIALFREFKLSYGNTALCLSGGGGFGNFHWGVIKALAESGYLPKIISGTSAGAVVAAVVATRSKEELKDALKPELADLLTCFEDPTSVVVRRFLRKGHLYELSVWETKLLQITGDYTFAEAFQKTGIVLNIAITSKKKNGPPKILNYITSPNVLIYTAILASSALPRFTQPISLRAKDEEGRIMEYHLTGMHWSDGSISSDLPMQTLAELFNVSYFIASQVNPHIIPFFFNSRGAVGTPRRRQSWRGLSWRGGFVLSFFESFLKRDMIKWGLVLRDLDMFPVIFELDMRQFFTQTFSGQVTITPRPIFSDYFRIISDPTRDILQRYILSSQIETYKRMSMIETRCKIGNTLDDCFQKLQKLAAAGAGRERSGSITQDFI